MTLNDAMGLEKAQQLLLASRADAFGAVTSIFMQEVFRWQRERAREAGLLHVRSGAVAMQHRSGSSLNLHPHIHAGVPDGVFLQPNSDGRTNFQQLRPPESDELEDIVFNLHQRFRRWLGRHGLLNSEAGDNFSNEAPDLSALEACSQASLGLGNLVTVRNKPQEPSQPEADQERFERRGSGARVAERDGYSLYVGEAIPGTDRAACKRLLRYCLRPPLSLERLSLGRDGSVIYQVKATRRGKATQRLMDPMQFMARVAALIPPPYHPLLRYFGVFAPHPSWRAASVPQLAETTEEPSARVDHHAHGNARQSPQDQEPEIGQSASTGKAPPRTDTMQAQAGLCPPRGLSTPIVSEAARGSSRAVVDDHLDDSAPRLPRPRWYIDWHTLLKRVHDVDSLACPCGGRLRLVQLVTEPPVAQDMLPSMGLADQPPPVARARSPAFEPDPLPPNWD